MKNTMFRIRHYLLMNQLPLLLILLGLTCDEAVHIQGYSSCDFYISASGVA